MEGKPVVEKYRAEIESAKVTEALRDLVDEGSDGDGASVSAVRRGEHCYEFGLR